MSADYVSERQIDLLERYIKIFDINYTDISYKLGADVFTVDLRLKENRKMSLEQYTKVVSILRELADNDEMKLSIIDNMFTNQKDSTLQLHFSNTEKKHIHRLLDIITSKSNGSSLEKLISDALGMYAHYLEDKDSSIKYIEINNENRDLILNILKDSMNKCKSNIESIKRDENDRETEWRQNGSKVTAGYVANTLYKNLENWAELEKIIDAVEKDR